MFKSIILSSLLLLAMNEPGCEVETKDSKAEAHQPAKPSPGCANLQCTELAPAATPDYGPDPTFEVKEEKESEK